MTSSPQVTAALPFEDASVTYGSWVALVDMSTLTRDGSLEHLLHAVKPRLLDALISSSQLPSDLLELPIGARDDFMQLREDMRGVLRAAIFVDAPVVPFASIGAAGAAEQTSELDELLQRLPERGFGCPQAGSQAANSRACVVLEVEPFRLGG